MKLIGLVFFGFVSSVIIGILLSMLVPRVFPDFYGDDPRILFISVLIVIPIAFLIGSIFTGYFSYYSIEDKWMLLWLPPAMYCNLLFLCLTVGSFLLEEFVDAFMNANYAENAGFFKGLWGPVLIALYWHLMSLAGVGFGYFLRAQIVRWWYREN